MPKVFRNPTSGGIQFALLVRMDLLAVISDSFCSAYSALGLFIFGGGIKLLILKKDGDGFW